MEQVIVEVFLPAAGKRFDVRIPLDLNVSALCNMLARALSDLSEGSYIASRSHICCLAWQETGALLDFAKTARECGVRNASKLLII